MPLPSAASSRTSQQSSGALARVSRRTTSSGTPSRMARTYFVLNLLDLSSISLASRHQTLSSPKPTFSTVVDILPVFLRPQAVVLPSQEMCRFGSRLARSSGIFVPGEINRFVYGRGVSVRPFVVPYLVVSCTNIVVVVVVCGFANKFVWWWGKILAGAEFAVHFSESSRWHFCA